MLQKLNNKYQMTIVLHKGRKGRDKGSTMCCRIYNCLLNGSNMHFTHINFLFLGIQTREMIQNSLKTVNMQVKLKRFNLLQ